MTSLDPAGGLLAPGPALGRATLSAWRQGRALVPAFAATLFLSAFLLFSIQPMFAKMALPKLGGAPGVWSVAMVFFQATLLLGYAYAHALARNLSLKRAVWVHLGVMVAAMACLPIGLSAMFGRPPADGAEFWLAGLLAVSIGAPVFAVSANGPLLQAWFARSGHAHAQDPYFLYGASNAGSFLALLAYPFALEPLIGAAAQSQAWTVGFLALGVAIGACGLLALRNAPALAPDAARQDEDADAAPAPAWRDKLLWTALAFIPSGLLVAVTAHLSTDIASAPFMWIAPLALFLLTFVIAFQRRPALRHSAIMAWHPALALSAALALVVTLPLSAPVQIGLHIGSFFVAAMACHGELARRRPASRHLTGFYLWLSAGGVLGGIFAGLIAPRLFSSIVEYPLLLAASLFVVMAAGGSFQQLARWGAIAAGVLAAALAPLALGFDARAMLSTTAWLSLAAVVWICLIARRRHRESFLALACAGIAALAIYSSARRGESYFARSFFGVHKVFESSDGQFRVLAHGTTLHGAQRIRDANGQPLTGLPMPTNYYHSTGPIAGALSAFRGARGGKLDAVLAIGLGTGSLACHIQAQERWTFFEIDQKIIDIAQDPAKFSFLSGCAPQTPIALGDARLTIADQSPGQAAAIVVDAFSSDAIPVHLLTREALKLYVSRLDERGAIIFHISNNHMELASAIAALGASEGLVVYGKKHTPSAADMEELAAASEVAVVARDKADLGAIANDPTWKRLEAPADVAPWTDDYAHALGAIVRRYRGVSLLGG